MQMQDMRWLTLQIDRHWSALGSNTYDNVAGTLLDLAEASTPEARQQYALLAALYQELGLASANLPCNYSPAITAPA